MFLAIQETYPLRSCFSMFETNILFLLNIQCVANHISYITAENSHVCLEIYGKVEFRGRRVKPIGQREGQCLPFQLLFLFI